MMNAASGRVVLGGLVALAASACTVNAPHYTSNEPDGPPADDDAAVNTTCDRNTPFATPITVSGLTTPAFEGMARFSPDERTVYFSGERAPATNRELYVAQRSSATEAFGTATPLMSLNSTAGEYDPTVSADALTIMFTSDRVSGEGLHIYVATRGSTLAQFDPPALVANVNSAVTADHDRQPFLSPDAQTVWLLSNRSGGVGTDDIWRATRSGPGFGTPIDVGELGSTDQDWAATPSSDGLLIYFSSNRPGTVGGLDIWMSYRQTTAEAFASPTRVTEISTDIDESPVWLSPDQCRLYLNRSGDILVATRAP